MSVTETSQEQTKPQGNNAPKDQNNATKQKTAGQQRRPFTPLTEGEQAEIHAAIGRSPGLGRIVLNVIRNRNARVIVPETSIGDELLTHSTELDRVLHRMGTRLTRNLNVDAMKRKAEFEMKAAELIQPLRQITAEMGCEFDDPAYPIIHHPETKKLVAEIKRSKKSDAQTGNTVETA